MPRYSRSQRGCRSKQDAASDEQGGLQGQLARVAAPSWSGNRWYQRNFDSLPQRIVELIVLVWSPELDQPQDKEFTDHG